MLKWFLWVVRPNALLMLVVFLVRPAFGALANIEETEEYWLRREAETLRLIAEQQPINGRAKNIILFVGDGMGIATVTAARILAGQNLGLRGEEHQLAMDKLPWSAY